MLARRLAGRYAEALFDLAQGQGKTDEWEGQLAALAAAFAAAPDLLAVLMHPEIALPRKQQILREAFRDRVAPEMQAMMSLLLRRGHEPDIATIHEVFRDLWNIARRVTPVVVTTAAPMTDQQRGNLVATLVRRVGTEVQLEQRVDPEIIAGMVVRMGDRVIDASARTVLEELRAVMRGA